MTTSQAPVSALNKVMRDTVNSILGLSNFTIASRQKDAPRPIGSYADVDFLSEQALSWYEEELIQQGAGSLSVTYTDLREITFSLGFYRDDAFDNARRCHVGLQRQSIRSAFNTAKIGLTSRSDVRQISENLEDGIELRAQFDITLSVVGRDSEIIGCIEQADISATLDSIASNIPIINNS